MESKSKRGEDHPLALSLSSAALSKDIRVDSKFTNEKSKVGVEPSWHVDSWCIWTCKPHYRP